MDFNKKKYSCSACRVKRSRQAAYKAAHLMIVVAKGPKASPLCGDGQISSYSTVPKEDRRRRTDGGVG